MQKKNQNKASLIKQIILYTILVILVLLILFAEDIIKLTNKNKTNLAENSENTIISNEPNAPKTSAGMIPVKANGENWVITTKEDKDWYDYKNGKPAYIMLNDGVYQSELIVDMTNKKLAEENIGKQIQPSELGTIFMWIPRFVYNESGEIAYIKEETTPGEDWIVPDLFMYKIPDETKPDFSLSGVWIQKDVDLSLANKITEMKKEEGIYGFLAHTKAKQITLNDTAELQKYVGTDDQWSPLQSQESTNTDITQNVGASIARPPIDDITNTNRIILQIINTKMHEPIKANITQNTIEGKIEIRVTYTSNGISKIQNEYGEQMPLTVENGAIYTYTSSNALARGTYKFIVIDNKGNKKELSIAPNIDAIYKVAYVSGTDNTDNTATYNKTQGTKTESENTLIEQLNQKDSSLTYSKAIQNDNAITAIAQRARTSDDAQMYLYDRYRAKSTTKYSWTAVKTETVSWTKSDDKTWGIKSVSTDSANGSVKFGASR